MHSTPGIMHQLSFRVPVIVKPTPHVHAPCLACPRPPLHPSSCHAAAGRVARVVSAWHLQALSRSRLGELQAELSLLHLSEERARAERRASMDEHQRLERDIQGLRLETARLQGAHGEAERLRVAAEGNGLNEQHGGSQELQHMNAQAQGTQGAQPAIQAGRQAD